MRLLLGSFVCSVLVTGAGAQWYPPSPGPNITVVYPPPQPISVVVQSPPEVVVMRASPIEEYVPAAQVTYLIAFKNSLVRLADQYWVKGKTLYFVTADRRQLTAPLDSVDRGLSQLLNSERNVVFFLPAEQERTIAQVHVIRHTAISARKQCRCTCSRPRAGQASRANPAAK